jgi:hypothetical protein
MNGIPPASPSDSEDVAWALETADALWKRGERVDAVVWVRRAAQAAGEGEDAKRAAALARHAAELGDWIGAHTVGGAPDVRNTARKPKDASLAALDALLSDPPETTAADEVAVSSHDVEFVSASDFEAGFREPPELPAEDSSEHEVMTVSIGAPDVEIIDEEKDSRALTDEYEDQDVTLPRGAVASGRPGDSSKQAPLSPPPVPSAAQAHAGMLDPWADADSARGDARAPAPGATVDARAPGSRAVAPKPGPPPRVFEQDEVVTSARRSVPKIAIPPADGESAAEASVPPAPRAPQFPQPRARAQDPSAAAKATSAPSVRDKLRTNDDEEVETTTYRQINPRSGPERERSVEPPANRVTSPTRPLGASSEPRVPSKGPLDRPAPPRPSAKHAAGHESPAAKTESLPKPPRHSVPEPMPARARGDSPQPKPARHSVPEPSATKADSPQARAPRPSVPEAPSTKPPSPLAKARAPQPSKTPEPTTHERSWPPGPDLLELANSVELGNDAVEISDDAVEIVSDPPPPIPAGVNRALLTPIPSGVPTPVPDAESPSRAPTPRPGAVTVSPGAEPSDSPTPPPPLRESDPVEAVFSNVPTHPPESSRPSEPSPSRIPTRPPDSASAPSPAAEAEAAPPSVPTRPQAGSTLLDLSEVEALGDLPDDAREAFGRAATVHEVSTDEEVSHFALALVISGKIDVSATIVDTPAMHLERNAILRSRGTITPGVGLRLVCSSEKAVIATWDEAAVEAAFRSCPWVEDDLRSLADRVQARAGMTMGPLGERFDLSLREHMTGKLTIRVLAPGELLVAEGKPVPIAIVGIGELTLTKGGAPEGAVGPGEFLFPTQILAHGKAPATASAGEAGAVVFYGDRAVSQELLMSFPPLLEVLATL